MAILLGAFLLVGLQPGPEMLTKHLDITFAMVWILVIANIVTAGVAFLFLNQLVKITFVRGGLLIPFLLMFVFLGSFTAHNSINDIVVTIIFGLLGYFMVLFEWPRPPFVLGLVLGRIAENNLWISSSAYGASWLLHPAIIVIFVLIVTTLSYSIINANKRKRLAASDESGTSG
jgi:TctA family transporter